MSAPAGQPNPAALTSTSTVQLLTGAVAGLPQATAAQVLTRAARGPASAAALHDYLAAHPHALNAVDAEAPPAVLHLVHLLARDGYPVTPPACTNCGRTGPRLIRRGPSGRVCDMCWLKHNQRVCARCGRVGRAFQRTEAGVICSRCHQRDYRQPCGRCGQIWQVAGRLPDGSALCQRCYQRPARICIRCRQPKPAHANTQAGPVCDHCYRQPERICAVCGRTRPISRRATASTQDICNTCASLATTSCSTCGRTRRCRRRSGRMLCAACHPPRPRRRCAACGQHRTIAITFPLGPVCATCHRRLGAHPGACAACGNNRPLLGVTSTGAGVCGPCAGAGDAFDCRCCGATGLATSHGLCPHCLLRARVHDLLTGPDGNIATNLEPLAQALLRTDRPHAILRWLRRTAAAHLLVNLARSGQPITHQHLDQLPPSQALRAARKVLVACGILPERHEYIESVQPWLNALIAGQPTGHQQTITSYARWAVLHRARRKAAFNTPTAGTNNTLRSKIRIVVKFLTWLDHHHLTLATLTQRHLDQWLATGGHQAYQLRYFIGWARTRRLIADLNIPTAPRHRNTSATITEDQRWHQLHRCLHDEQLPLDLRVTGALLLLYGHHVGRTVRLSADAYTTRGNRHYLKLGRTPVLLPPPLADLIRRQLAQPPPTSLGEVMNTTTWLLPSTHPGRHREAKTLIGRLATLGITATQGRRAALMALADDLPAAVLASLLGIHIGTAVNWTRELNRDWTTYLSTRQPPNPAPSSVE
jgi:hypothetical protein